jgi:beta-mannosidase
VRLRAQSLDYSGSVLIDDIEAGTFKGALTPVLLDITTPLRAGAKNLTIVFTALPDDLGQIGWTSRIRDWKARFNYGWDWTPRIVQVGIAGPIGLEVIDGVEIEGFDVRTEFDPERSTGSIRYRVTAPRASGAELVVTGPGHESTHQAIADGEWHTIELGAVLPWVVHPDGEQALYTALLRARGERPDDIDEETRRVGFRSVRWLPVQDSPAGADPWLLELNGEPTFMAGINWVPIRPDYADVQDADYVVRFSAYRELGINTLRIWGGAARESDTFYRLADELGFLLWQELPLSSSGLDNLPPDDAEFAAEYAEIARSYARDLAHHPALVLWGGGNELASADAATLDPVPATREQSPFAAGLAVIAEVDPSRRFVPSSPSGPRPWARPEEFGQGLHHDVHGPWSYDGDIENWHVYWDADDAVLRSEVGVDGASSYELLERHGLVGPTSTPEEREQLAQRWGHSSAWWLKRFRSWDGSGTLREWVEADQARQAELLSYAAASAKRRFPRCAGFIVWLGHDTFPCPTSLSLLDFDGTIKPAGRAVAAAFADPDGPR